MLTSFQSTVGSAGGANVGSGVSEASGTAVSVGASVGSVIARTVLDCAAPISHNPAIIKTPNNTIKVLRTNGLLITLDPITVVNTQHQEYIALTSRLHGNRAGPQRSAREDSTPGTRRESA